MNLFQDQKYFLVILNIKKRINFYDKTYNLIYNKNFVGNNEEDEILGKNFR